MNIEPKGVDCWLAFEQADASVRATTFLQSSRIVELMHSVLGHYYDAFGQTVMSEAGEAVVVQMSLASQNLNTLRVAIDAAEKGYYIQALSLTRLIHENWLAHWYLVHFPHEARLWLNMVSNKRPPMMSEMRKKMKHPEPDAESKLRDIYAVLCRFAHTDPTGVISKLNVEHDRVDIGIGTEFDANDFSASAYLILLMGGLMLDVMSRWIPIQHEWHCGHDRIRKDVAHFMEDYNALNDISVDEDCVNNQ